MGKILKRDRSIIPACDVPLKVFEQLVKATADLDVVSGYKLGPALTGRPGYDAVVNIARLYTDKPLIFDGQKWGTDIPDTALSILEPLKESGVDAVILFPQAGPVVEMAWIRTAQELGLGVIVGGEMTHPRYLDGDFSNERNKDGSVKTNYSAEFHKLGMADQTGFISQRSPEMMYLLAAMLGVEDFVVPGNKPERIALYKSYIEDKGGIKSPSFFSPGFVNQGGEVSKGAAAAGRSFHAIAGRGIYEAKDMRQAALDLGSKL